MNDLQQENRILRAKVSLYERNPMAALSAMPVSEFYCDGYNCSRRTECARFTLRPADKAAYWARKPVDGACDHFKSKEHQ